MTVRTWLIDIPPADCDALLASSALGRLAVVVDGRPEIFPVNHVFDRETRSVAFPTNPGTKLHASLHWPWVAFEVDGIGDDGGWSVMIVGRAEEITDTGEIARLTAQRSARWRSSGGEHWVRVVPSNITGRRISVA